MDGCTLSPDDLKQRIAWIQAELLPHVRVWELEDAPGVQQKLEQWIALERQCCTSLALRVTRRWGRLRLTLGRPGPGRLQSLAKLGGAGVLGSLALCCGLPLVAAGFTGGAALGGWTVGLGGVLATVGFLWWRRRRASACDCSVA
jgi:hypothetical protein